MINLDRGIYPPKICIFVFLFALTPPIFIGIPCTHSMFSSPSFANDATCATRYKDKRPKISCLFDIGQSSFLSHTDMVLIIYSHFNF